ncbi:DUF1223 domain-containing protein [Thalassospira marina]|uniref:DUF1223 domain-containing protein n=1 Tax=Thalassospira marina TaxID=2048283 RepID=A0A2N3KU02_9PROT|nr:DUF1223 domain-containing protein [Thalassospira marina]AUG54114.1 DUF1223 domain-containing protein [Thalassospira marina]PKR54025.1 DUF1223 domain-containing protein [Thalassospira marina]
MKIEKFKSLWGSALAALLALAVPGPAHAAAGQNASITPQAVVELFTSEGCSSCPPADAVLRDISDETDNLLLLSFHVDYWNYLGWKDRFSEPAYTDRQRKYATFQHESYVYTPQIMINGAGSVRATHKDAILEAALKKPSPLASWVTIKTDSTAGQKPGGIIKLEAAKGDIPQKPLKIWLVGFDRKASTDVEAGENAGRNLKHVNIVRELDDLGTWDGKAREIPVRLEYECNGGIAVLLQEENGGPIRSASMARF